MSEQHAVVTHDEWIDARKALLAKEKEFTRLRDDLSRQRRDLPWEAVDKEYVFEGRNGSETLSELFDGRSQLIVYHFMFDPRSTTAASTARSGRTASTRTSSTSTLAT